jgi:hypothetical protein
MTEAQLTCHVSWAHRLRERLRGGMDRPLLHRQKPRRRRSRLVLDLARGCLPTVRVDVINA